MVSTPFRLTDGWTEMNRYAADKTCEMLISNTSASDIRWARSPDGSAPVIAPRRAHLLRPGRNQRIPLTDGETLWMAGSPVGATTVDIFEAATLPDGGTGTVEAMPDREELVNQVAAATEWPDGTELRANGLAYQVSAGADVIPDLPGLVPLPPFSAAQWGVVAVPNDGTTVATDYSAALQAAIDYIGGPGVGGGDLILGSGVFGIGSTVYLGEGGPVTLVGTGRGEIMNSKPLARASSGTRICWTGAAGGTMFKFTPDRDDSGLATRTEGGGLLSVHLDGQVTAGIGVHVQSHSGNTIRIRTSYFTQVHFLSDVLANGLTVGPADTQRCRWNIHCDDVNTTQEPQAMVVFSGSNIVSPAANTSLTTVEELRLSAERGAVAAHFGNCDAMQIERLFAGARTGATGDGGKVIFHASDTLPAGLGTTAADGRARHISIGLAQATEGITAKAVMATGVEANDITIDHLSRGNGAPLPDREAYDSQITWKTSEGDISARRFQGVTVNPFHAYGGAADAIEIETGGEFTSLTAGIVVRFRATATNTGPATLAVDGVPAKPTKTVTGDALPAGYIRTDLHTEAYYDGTGWVVERQIERGSGTGGDWVRFADGTQICHHKLTLEYHSGSVLKADWVHDKAFAAVPEIFGSLNISSFNTNATPDLGEVGGINAGSTTTTSASIQVRRIPGMVNFEVGDSTLTRMTGIGRWY